MAKPYVPIAPELPTLTLKLSGEALLTICEIIEKAGYQANADIHNGEVELTIVKVPRG